MRFSRQSSRVVARDLLLLGIVLIGASACATQARPATGPATTIDAIEAPTPLPSTRPSRDVWVEVAYRETAVNLGADSVVRLALEPTGDVESAWWDSVGQYLVINLNGTNYHYCDFDGDDVQALVSADDVGVHYQELVRGTHDCRDLGNVPEYGDQGPTATRPVVGSGPYRDERLMDAEYDLGRPLDEGRDWEIIEEIDSDIDAEVEENQRKEEMDYWDD